MRKAEREQEKKDKDKILQKLQQDKVILQLFSPFYVLCRGYLDDSSVALFRAGFSSDFYILVRCIVVSLNESTGWHFLAKLFSASSSELVHPQSLGSIGNLRRK